MVGRVHAKGASMHTLKLAIAWGDFKQNGRSGVRYAWLGLLRERAYCRQLTVDGSDVSLIGIFNPQWVFVDHRSCFANPLNEMKMIRNKYLKFTHSVNRLKVQIK